VVSAESVCALVVELVQFEVDLGELGLSLSSEAAYRQLCAVAKDRAHDAVELEVEFGRGQML
jgi:hypothetical protein